jgi:hypothetical protein
MMGAMHGMYEDLYGGMYPAEQTRRRRAEMASHNRILVEENRSLVGLVQRMAEGRPISQRELDDLLSGLESGPESAVLAAGHGVGDRELWTVAGWGRAIAGCAADTTWYRELARVALDVAADQGLRTDGYGYVCQSEGLATVLRWPGWVWRLAYARVGSPREWELRHPHLADRRAALRRAAPMAGHARRRRTVPSPEDIMRRYLQRTE